MCSNPNEKTECHNLKKTLKQLNNCDCEECTKLLSRSRNGPKKELKQRRVDNTAKRQLLPFYDDQSPPDKQSKKTETKKDSNKIKSRNTPKNLKSNPVSDENESDGKASPSLAPIPISTSSSEDEDEIECKDELEKDDYGNKVNDEENDIDD